MPSTILVKARRVLRICLMMSDSSIGGSSTAERHKLTMCEVLCIVVFVAAIRVHIQELGQQPYSRFRADIQGLHERDREGSQELNQ